MPGRLAIILASQPVWSPVEYPEVGDLFTLMVKGACAVLVVGSLFYIWLRH